MDWRFFRMVCLGKGKNSFYGLYWEPYPGLAACHSNCDFASNCSDVCYEHTLHDYVVKFQCSLWNLLHMGLYLVHLQWPLCTIVYKLTRTVTSWVVSWNVNLSTDVPSVLTSAKMTCACIVCQLSQQIFTRGRGLLWLTILFGFPLFSGFSGH
jgi:hypothetical protein